MAPQQAASCLLSLLSWKQTPLLSWMALGGSFKMICLGLTNEVLKQRDINQVMFVLTGYFIYDFFDMVFNQKLSQSWELLFHHTVVGLSHIKAIFSQGTT